MFSSQNIRAKAGQLSGDAMLAAIATLWGANMPIMKFMLMELDVPGLMALRFLFTIALMAPILWFKRSLVSWPLVKGGIVCGAILTLVMVFGIGGVALTSANRANFLISLFMVVVPIFSFLIYGRKPKPSLILAILAAALGVYFLTMADTTQNLPLNLGDGLCLIAMVFNALHIIAVGHYGCRHDIYCLNTIQMAVVALAAMVWSLSVGAFTLAISPPAWLCLFILVVVCTIFTFGGQFWGQRRTTAERAAVIITLYPLSGAVICALMLNEHMGFWGYVGGALIMSAVFITVASPKPIDCSPAVAVPK